MIHYIAETGSTNADLIARIRVDEAVHEGDWLVADRQTAGRGRQGRKWIDQAGNFMGSTVICLNDGDPPAHSLALLASLALYEALIPCLPDPGMLMLKWPNDLMLGSGKLSGILLEREKNAVILGIGVNLAKAPDIPGRQTACMARVAPAVARNHFADMLAASLDQELHRWRMFGLSPIHNRWLAVAHPRGTALAVHDGDGAVTEGVFDGLAQDGSLILRLADGHTHAIHAGDVMLAM